MISFYPKVRSNQKRMPVVSVPVNAIHPILEPFRFLEQHHDEHHGCDWNGNEGVNDGEYDEVD